jgi:hypothetical protein
LGSATSGLQACKLSAITKALKHRAKTTDMASLLYASAFAYI